MPLSAESAPQAALPKSSLGKLLTGPQRESPGAPLEEPNPDPHVRLLMLGQGSG